MKFDETEGSRPFVVEREQALATARVCVLVDADHLDPSQTTLRWDQLPVRVPRGAQHSKVVLLVWENFARLIISSANLTRTGYRRNREIAGVVDCYDHESAAPRRLLLDSIAFLHEVRGWVRASDATKVRLRERLQDARNRIRSWRRAPGDFRPLERPRATFVGGLPRQNGGVDRSPLEQVIEIWGTRRASEITVMTPFVGDLAEPIDPVAKKLLQLPRTREATGHLVVPGHPSEKAAGRTVVGLPRRFLERWAAAWRVDPNGVATYVVPLCRPDEKVNRDLHAKGILIAGEGASILLCGSSNFSPHGMGVGIANTEANLCYLDDSHAKRNGMLLEDRLPVNWNTDRCERPVWPEMAEPIDDEQAGTDRPLPAVFLWAVYNQRTAVLTIAVDPSKKFPAEWSLRWPGERTEESPALIDHSVLSSPPSDGRITIQLPESLRGANIAGLRLSWHDVDGLAQTATLLVHIENGEDLLPPEEFRSLTADGILECLLSGREPAEWVDAMERRLAGGLMRAPEEFDSLRTVDTSAYVLYRTRRLGAALAALGKRLLRTVRTREAIAYRLRQDPLGPLMLAEALTREVREASATEGPRESDSSVLLFALAEIHLMVAHVARRLTEPHLRTLFRTAIAEIERLCEEVASADAPARNVSEYLKSVKRKSEQLLEGATGGVRHAG